MAKLRHHILLSDDQRVALERVALAFPENGSVEVIADSTTDVFTVDVLCPGLRAIKTFGPGRLEDAIAFLEHMAKERGYS